jgi:hypothetical protein
MELDFNTLFRISQVLERKQKEQLLLKQVGYDPNETSLERNLRLNNDTPISKYFLHNYDLTMAA